VHKAVKSADYPLITDLHSCSTQVGPGTYGYNTGHVFDVDNTSPASVSGALIYGRRQAAQYHAAFKSLHPAFANSHLIATGALMGVRETRRITGDYVLAIDDYLARRNFPDEICRNAYNIDIHSQHDPTAPDRSISELKHRNAEAIKQLGKGESYGIPYRCLTPRRLSNLLVAGRCISTDRSTNGSVRIMACCLTTGEAAGTAAAMAAASNRDVHAVDTDDLRTRLRRYGAYLP
jgi:hypothetical protein